MDTIQGCVKALRQHVPQTDQDKTSSSSVDALDELMDACSTPHVPPGLNRIAFLEHEIIQARKKIDGINRQRYTSLNKLSRAIERVIPENAVDLIPPDLFRDPACEQALDQAVFEYLTRIGDGSTASKFLEVCLRGFLQ